MSFYRQVRSRPPGAAFAYLSAFVLLMTVLSAASLAPEVLHGIATVRDHVSSRVPDGTTFIVKDGKFSTNAASASEFGPDDVAIVVDASVEGTEPPKAFEERAGAFIGRDAVFVRDAVSVRAYPMADVPDIATDKAGIVAWLDGNGWLLAAGALAAFAVAYYLMVFIGSLAYAALVAAGMLVVAKLWRVDMPYSRWVATGLHAATLPTIVDALAVSLGWELPFAYPVPFFIIAFAVLLDERMRPTQGRHIGGRRDGSDPSDGGPQ